MINHNISQLAESDIVVGAVVAGTDAGWVTGTEVDLIDCQSVMFEAILGTVTAGGIFEMRVKLSNTSGSYGAGTIDLAMEDGVIVSQANTPGTQQKVVLEISGPMFRFARIEYRRTVANVVITGVTATRYRRTARPASTRRRVADRTVRSAS